MPPPPPSPPIPPHAREEPLQTRGEGAKLPPPLFSKKALFFVLFFLKKKQALFIKGSPLRWSPFFRTQALFKIPQETRKPKTQRERGGHRDRWGPPHPSERSLWDVGCGISGRESHMHPSLATTCLWDVGCGISERESPTTTLGVVFSTTSVVAYVDGRMYIGKVTLGVASGLTALRDISVFLANGGPQKGGLAYISVSIYAQISLYIYMCIFIYTCIHIYMYVQAQNAKHFC